jgi:hypothetical protein
MSTYSAEDTGSKNRTDRDRTPDHSVRHATTETKPAFKTTEIIFYLLTVAGVLIASALVDENADGQGFGAEKAWLYVTLLTIGYMVSRGIAKAGSYERDNDPRTNR